MDVLREMFKHNQITQAKNSNGETPLMYSAESNFKKMVEYLSVRTSNLNEEDKQGMTILMYQVLQKNYKVASRLIRRGASLDYVNCFGHTALHFFVEKGLVEQIQYLLFKGANPHIMDLHG